MTDAVELRARGEQALRAGDAAAAEAAYRALLFQTDTDIYAMVGIGLVARLRGARAEALRLFEQAAQAHPANTWPLLEISAELNATGQSAEAQAILRTALAIDAQNYHCIVGMARLLRAAGDGDGAAALFREAIEQHPRQPAAAIELAELLARDGRNDDALAVIEAGLAAGCAPGQMQAARAGALLACGRPEAALLAYREVAGSMDATGPARRDAAFAAFRIARDSQQNAVALACIEHAAAADPLHVPIQCELAGQYRAASRLREAEAKYRDVLRIAPANLAALGGLAIVLRLSGDCEAALALLRQAHALDAGNEWIRFELALTWRDLGQLDDAGAVLETIEPGQGIYVWARMTLGHMARARLEHRLAAAYFGQAARHAADPTDALCQIAAECRAVGDFAAAEAAVERVFSHAPGSWQAHMAQGYVCRARSDTLGARDAFRRAAAAAPTQASQWACTGASKGASTGAPTRVKALVEMAAEDADLGNDAAAAAAIGAALRLDPRHEGALLKRAALLTESGDHAAALAVYGDLRAARPASVSGYLGAAQLLCDRGEPALGLELLAEAARACAAGAQIDLRRAGILRQLGLLDEACAVLTAVQARFGRELTPWCHLVSAVIDLGRFGEAAALLAAPPAATGRAAARINVLRAQLAKAQWSLEPAIAAFDAAIELDSLDSQALYERAKLRLVTFDITGAHADLVAHSGMRRLAARREGRSANPSQTHVGQLYDEFVLDRDVAGALTAARDLPADQQIPVMADLVRRYPESTAAAIGLMIALRRAGRLAGPAVAAGAARIPPLISQYWNDAVAPPDVRVLQQSWHAVQPHATIETFDDAAATKYLRARCGAAVARAFGMAAEPAQRADIFRLARLYREGGFYIDADDRARGGVSAHVPDGTTLFAHQEDLGSIGNNVIGAVPGHDVIGAALRAAVQAVLRGDRDIVWLSTGPGLLTRALAQWFAAAPAALEARLAGTCVLTLAEMRCCAAMHCHAAYKTTHRAWLNSAFPARRRG